MRVVVSLLSYPPVRFLGAELMTHEMLKRLQRRGHDVQVIGQDITNPHVWESVTIRGGALPTGDLLIYHADFNEAAKDWRGPKVAICHNDRIGVVVGLRNTRPELATVNSNHMHTSVPYPWKMTVHPPVTVPPKPVHGEAVTLINMEKTSKVGPFWEVAAAMPDHQFIGVLGGYGEQDIRTPLPPNVTILDQVQPSEMAEKVWAKTKILLVPSATESWSMAASEAMAHGIPVIAHPLPGLRENLQGVGVWAHRDQPQQYVDAINRINASWDEHSKAVRARAVEQEKQFDTEVEQWCDRLEKLAC